MRSGELPAVKVGGRGAWRVEHEALEDYNARMYADAREFVRTHPFTYRGDSDYPTLPLVTRSLRTSQ